MERYIVTAPSRNDTILASFDNYDTAANYAAMFSENETLEVRIRYSEKSSARHCHVVSEWPEGMYSSHGWEDTPMYPVPENVDA